MTGCTFSATWIRAKVRAARVFVSLCCRGESHLMPGRRWRSSQRLPGHKTAHKHRNNQGRTRRERMDWMCVCVCVCVCVCMCVCACVKARWNIIAHLPAWNSLKLNVNSAPSQTFFINEEHCTSIQLMKYWFGNCIVRRRKAFKVLSAFA